MADLGAVDETPQGIDQESLVVALDAVIEQNPDALFAAVNVEGIFVPAPPELTARLTHQRVIQLRSALDMVVAADRVVVIEAWERARQVGGARASVHLAGMHEEPVAMHFFDLRPTYGVLACVVLAPKGADPIEVISQAPPLVPRVTWTQKSDMAELLATDPEISKILGWAPEEMVGKRSLDFIHPDDQDRSIENWMTMLASRGDGPRVRLRHLRKDGTYLWMEFSNRNLLDDPEHGYVLAQMIDISDEMAAHEALRAREELLTRLAEALPTGLLHLNARREVLYTNDRLHQIIGLGPASSVEQQLAAVVPEDRPGLDVAIGQALAGGDAEVEVRVRHPDSGELRLCAMSLRSLRVADAEGAAAIVSVADVTESVQLRRELEDRATFDALTRCHNRSSVMRILEEAAGAELRTVGVVFADLDRFKAVNDELGHAAGDELLSAVAQRLRGVVRTADVVGRLGGDEFLVVCPGLSGPEEAIDIAERVAAALRQEVALGDVVVDLRASVGVSWSSHGASSADDLVARADTAMYESKRRGVGEAVPYAPALRRASGVRLDDERALHLALDRGELAVHFQPIVELSTGAAIGFESLVRWSRGARGLTASEFIEVAERTGLIHALGGHMREVVLHAASRLRTSTGSERLWFLNLSLQELQMPGIAESLLESVEGHGVPAECLVVEFHCASIGSELDAFTGVLHDLRSAGVSIGLDDFGGRGSSLELLRMLPLQWVKLASGFTASLVSDAASASIVDAVLGLADRLGLAAVVKGVETPEQRERLLGMGARLAQGHLFAAPAPLEQLIEGGSGA